MPIALDSVRTEPDTFVGETPTAFFALCAEAAEGSGRFVLVEGAAGTGKSSLLAGLAHGAPDGFRVLRARGTELEADNPFGTIRRLFESSLEDAPPAQREALLAGADALSRRLFTRDPRHPLPESGFGVLHGIYRLTANMARETPLLMVIDDLHWADPPSLRGLGYLANRLADLPIVLAASIRPAEPGSPVDLIEGVCAQPSTLRVRTSALDAETTAAFVRDRLPGAPDELCDACLEAAGGNPAYLRELLGTLAAHATVADVRSAALPHLGDRMIRRAARVGPEAERLIRAAAVLGDGARLSDVACVARLPDVSAAEAAVRLQRIEVLRRDSPVEFRHPIVRRSVYAALSVTDRNGAHAAAAKALRRRGADAEDVAGHLAKCDPTGSTEVVAALREAAVAATSRGAHHAAIALLDRALEERAPGPVRAELLADLGEAELLGSSAAASVHLRAALELETEPAAGARISANLGRILAARGEWTEAVDRTSSALWNLGDVDPRMTAELEAIQASVTAPHADLVSRFDPARDRLRALARESASLAAVVAFNDACRGRDPLEIRELAEVAATGSGWTISDAASAFVLIDDLEPAEAIARRLATRASSVMQGWLAVRRGALTDAEALFRGIVGRNADDAVPDDFGNILWWAWDALGERPGIDAVIARAALIEPADAFRSTAEGSLVYEARARVAFLRGDRDTAAVQLRKVERIRRAIGFGPVHSPWRSQLALALHPSDPDEAAALIAEERELAERAGLARPLGVVLRCAAAVERDDEVDLLRRSAELLAQSPARLEEARTLVALGSALRRRSFRTEARDLIRQGFDMAEKCGAQATARRAAEEFRAAGGRSPGRARARTGIAALTPSELRVARLVADNLSNDEIASELFVTLKTVETHLTHAYAKLEISGPRMRRRLAALIRERP